MFRICQKSIILKNSSQKRALLRDITSNTKCISGLQKYIRHFASKEKENNKLERIYYGPLTPQIRAVKMFSVSSSAIGLALQPILIREANSIGSTSLLIALCSVVGFFTFVTPILLHVITKKYVTEIHYDPETSTYKATTLNFFLVPVKLDFKPEDVVVPDIPGIFTTMVARGNPLFVEARFFTDPLYYAKIMGYDKPLDFKLGESQEKDNDNNKKL